MLFFCIWPMSEDRAQRVKFSDTHSSCQSSFACWMLLNAWCVFAFLQQVCLLDSHLRVGFPLQNWQRVHRNLHLVKKVSAVFTCSPVFPILPVWFIRQKHFICLVSHIKQCNPVHKSFYSVFAEQSFKFFKRLQSQYVFMWDLHSVTWTKAQERQVFWLFLNCAFISMTAHYTK